VPVLALLAQVDLPSLGGEGSGGVERLLAVFFVLMGVGFLLGILGHVIKSRTLVGIGIALIMVSTAVFLVAVARQG
jgi:hypothetical protein